MTTLIPGKTPFYDVDWHGSSLKRLETIDPVMVEALMDRPQYVLDIWASKYSRGDKDIIANCDRVAGGIYASDEEYHREVAFNYMASGLWMPGGRIMAGAGTKNRVTLMNCYVNMTVPDNMEGIADALKVVMLTQQQGGGIGTDFSPIRPSRAMLFRTGSIASGPIPFARTWDAATATIRSAGDRRGALMGTISDTHPDMPAFVVAKQQAGQLTNFNISVLISDAFMQAVEDDEMWSLHFEVPPGDVPIEEVPTFFDEETQKTQYVYSVWRAKALWELITKNTYEFSEPGVIFIDRVNDRNNLSYCEDIRCTNPCGEQPLPPNGTCNLGAVNLSMMVRHPFKKEAEFNWALLANTVQVGTRFLDNVIEATIYPLPEQQAEEFAKRRIGLGMTGLADAMSFLGIRYGSLDSARFTEKVMRTIATQTYASSHYLAEERGAFPLYDKEKFWGGDGFAARKFNKEDFFYGKKMRNGVLNTIAPTGTTSITFGNDCSSGLECVFAHEATRNVRQNNDEVYKPIKTYAFGARVWERLNPGVERPKHMVTMADLSVQEHIIVQEACQEWTDASISKTINLPKETTYEEFLEVYALAYRANLKGCTTYRPSDVRGSILSADGGSETAESTAEPTKPGANQRNEVIPAITAKMRWPAFDSATYLTIGYLDDGSPYEIFLNSKDQRNIEWMTCVTLLMSWLLRAGYSIPTIAAELKQIRSFEGQWADKKYHHSFVAFLGHHLEKLNEGVSLREAGTTDNSTSIGINISNPQPASVQESDVGASKQKSVAGMGRECPDCKQPTLFKMEGCDKCGCGYSKCS